MEAEMNLAHLKYAVEVAETGSINRAAERLYVGQPNLSRAIKELETSLGVEIFERSAKGMKLTTDGETFVQYARTILKQVDDVETIFKESSLHKAHFSISVPRASYIAEAFARFSAAVSKENAAEIFYRETNSKHVIDNMLQEDYKLGIIRYAKDYDRYFKGALDEKNFNYEMVADFHYILIINRNSPLADKEEITFSDLHNYVEIAHADPAVPSLLISTARKEEQPGDIPRRIFVFERASQFELLAQNPEMFMWVSPIPKTLLDRYGLVQRVCKENKRMYKDVLIYKKDYRLSKLDNIFIYELCKSRRETF